MTARNKALLYIALIALSLLYLFPVVWVVLSSFKDANELYAWPPRLFPKHFTLENYTTALEEGNFGRYFLNSAFVTITSTLLLILINTMAGFALAKYRFKGDTFILIAIISTLMIPLEVIMIPIFKVISWLGMYNSYWGIIIPPAATPTGVFLMRQFLLTVPDDLLEAGRIDGASEWRLYTRVILPIATPVVATLAIFSFMWRWDDFLWPLIVISTPEKYTIQLALSNFIGQYDVDWGSLLAMSVVSMIPVLIVFLIFQRQFVKGIVMTGIKG
ncbi:MAG: sugar ABC transporter permease [Thermobacillus sp. ZCTH02-B1]|uniref:carbohydrate ABC transporter permease n=1 Tax=Thermobacillus sp. ZCTH02-B1 TaxID=1858795 RepID=UPI000B568B50|nr:carbohydrate ABC transporter permease [Thermobacillus sp. ZCTH02-B1]OUM95629.1 MAG: sugar ABC transporter permease [Thermobacillus sp. ZCTH02-B1]